MAALEVQVLELLEAGKNGRGAKLRQVDATLRAFVPLSLIHI